MGKEGGAGRETWNRTRRRRRDRREVTWRGPANTRRICPSPQIHSRPRRLLTGPLARNGPKPGSAGGGRWRDKLRATWPLIVAAFKVVSGFSPSNACKFVLEWHFRPLFQIRRLAWRPPSHALSTPWRKLWRTDGYTPSRKRRRGT